MAATVEMFGRFNETRDFQENSLEQFEEGQGDFQQASMNIPIPENNIGHQLLVRQGWQAGQGLGKKLQGRVDPIPIVVKEEQLGFGRMEMELEHAEETTERRRLLECEKENTQELLEKYKENQEREKAKEESLADLRSSFFCDLCSKQYIKHTDFDNHMNSYDHAHKQRLKELKQKEVGRQLGSKRYKEDKKQEKEMKRINDFAESRVESQSNEMDNLDDICLPPADPETESSEVTMVDNDKLTVFFDRESPFVPPLPPPENPAKSDSQDAPEGKSLVSFGFSKRSSSKLTTTAGVFDSVRDNSKGKDINTKPDSDTIDTITPVESTDEKEMAGDSRGEFYHSSPPPHCKVKPQFQFLVFVKSDLKWDLSRSDGEKTSDTGVTSSDKAMVVDEGDSPSNPGSDGNLKDIDYSNKSKGNIVDTITDAKDISENSDMLNFPKNPNQRMLHFVKVVCAIGNNELDWPCEMVQLTTTDPTLCYSCNPLSFDFTQLSSKSKPKDKFKDKQGGVLVGDPAGDKAKTGDSTSAKKDKSKKKKKKRKKYRHKSHDSDKIGNEEFKKKARKKKKHRRKSSDKENEVATGTVVKTTDPKISKSKKHKKKRKSSKRRSKALDDTGGESGDNGKDDKQTTTTKQESKTEAVDDKSKQKHKRKKKRSKKRKKSKRSRHSDSGSEGEEEKDTPPGKEGEKKKEKVLKKKRQRKSGEENMSDSESEACETKSSQKSKPTRRYRKHKIPRLARDSSESETGRKTSAKPVVNEKIKNNPPESDVMKTVIPNSDKLPNTLEIAEKDGSSSHRSTGSRKKLLGTQTETEDGLKCKVVKGEEHPDDAVEKGVLKAETVKTDGILEKSLLKSEPGKTDDDFEGAGFEDIPQDAGKSKWDTSSDSELEETIIKMKTDKKTSLEQTLNPKLYLKCPVKPELSKNPGSVKGDAPKATVNTESHRTSDGSDKESDTALRPLGRGSEEREKSKNRHSDSDSADDRFSRSRSRSRSRRSRSFTSDSYDDRRSSRHSKRSYSSESDSRSRSSYRMKRSRSDSRSRKGYRSSRRHSSYSSYSDEDYHRSRSRSFSRSRRRDRSISRSRRSRHRRRSYSRSSSSRSRSRSYSSRSRSRSRTYRRSRSYDRGYRRQMKQSPDKQFSSVIPKRQKPSRQYLNKEKKLFEPNQLVAPIPYTTPKHGVSVEALQLLNKVKGKGDGVDAKHGYANASIPSATDKGPVLPLIGKLPAGKKGGVDEKEGKGLDDVSQIPTPDELSIPLPPLGNCNQAILTNPENKLDKQFIGPTLPNHHPLSHMQDIPLPTEPKKVNPQDRFQHIGPNDPLVFTSRIPPPPPVHDIESIPGMPAPPPPPPYHCASEQGTNTAPPLPPPQADAPPLPGIESQEIQDEVMENTEPESTDPMSMAPAIIIPPEQVEQYKALQAQAQLHAQHRQRVDAGLPDSDEEPEIDEIGEQQPITLIPARQIHPSLISPQPQVIQHMIRSPQQISFPTSLGHIPMLQPHGLHAVPHTAATLQIPQAGAPMVLAAPSHAGQLATLLPAGMTFAGHPHTLHPTQPAFHLPLSLPGGLQPQSTVLQPSTAGLAGLHHSPLPQHLVSHPLGGVIATRMPGAGPFMISPSGAVLVPRLPGHIQLQ